MSSYCVACHVGSDNPNNHPLGVGLADSAARRPGEFLYPPANPAVVLVSGATVECTTCHDDGSAGFPHKTVADELCTACHAL